MGRWLEHDRQSISGIRSSGRAQHTAGCSRTPCPTSGISRRTVSRSRKPFIFGIFWIIILNLNRLAIRVHSYLGSSSCTKWITIAHRADLANTRYAGSLPAFAAENMNRKFVQDSVFDPRHCKRRSTIRSLVLGRNACLQRSLRVRIENDRRECGSCTAIVNAAGSRQDTPVPAEPGNGARS